MFQYSKDKEHVSKLKILLDTIEWYIFSIPGLGDEYELPGRTFVKQGENAPHEYQQYQLEELQGAYLMIVLQYWTGNTAARTRVRQQRFPRVVAVSSRWQQIYLAMLILVDISPSRLVNSATLARYSDHRPTFLQKLDPERVFH